MKIAVIGCGAMGCYFGAKLSEKNEVVYIDAFPKTVDILNERGIIVKENDEEKKYNAPAFLSGKFDQPADLVVLFVKSTQNMAALSENEKLFTPNTIVMSLQNGFGNEREISRFVDPENIIIGNTLINCVTESVGITKKSGEGLTVIGSLVGNKKTALTARLCLEQSGIITDVSDDIKRVVWKKIFVNATLNPLTAMFGCKIKVVYENKNIWKLAEKIVEEAITVARKDGCEFSHNEVLEDLHKTCVNVGKGYTSMYQDVENKRFTEIEKINGQIVNLAYKYNVQAPYNEFVLNSIKAIEKLY